MIDSEDYRKQLIPQKLSDRDLEIQLSNILRAGSKQGPGPSPGSVAPVFSAEHFYAAPHSKTEPLRGKFWRCDIERVLKKLQNPRGDGVGTPFKVLEIIPASAEEIAEAQEAAELIGGFKGEDFVLDEIVFTFTPAKAPRPERKPDAIKRS